MTKVVPSFAIGKMSLLHLPLPLLLLLPFLFPLFQGSAKTTTTTTRKIQREEKKGN